MMPFCISFWSGTTAHLQYGRASLLLTDPRSRVGGGYTTLSPLHRLGSSLCGRTASSMASSGGSSRGTSFSSASSSSGSSTTSRAACTGSVPSVKATTWTSPSVVFARGCGGACPSCSHSSTLPICSSCTMPTRCTTSASCPSAMNGRCLSRLSSSSCCSWGTC
uniref:Uncharacterized protein n=1 Tax=Ixodes scapularis TaxID=6945 RepID=A0A4D5RAM4_IXOSC